MPIAMNQMSIVHLEPLIRPDAVAIEVVGQQVSEPPDQGSKGDLSLHPVVFALENG